MAGVEGVVAVALGGSRAQGTHRPDSDWDFGLYYRGTLDPEAIRALGPEAAVDAVRAALGCNTGQCPIAESSA